MSVNCTQSLPADDPGRLAEALVAATGLNVSIWRRDANQWKRIAPAGARDDVLQATLDQTLQEPTVTGPSECRVAVRINESLVAEARAPHGSGDLATRALEGALSRLQAESKIAELQQENDSFASQLTSDLEELTFLRSLVEELTESDPDEGLIGLAGSTLGVLNETVRAECLAFLPVKSGGDPFAIEPQLVIGPEQRPHRDLVELVTRFGPSAKNGPFVRNWESHSLARFSTNQDSERPAGVHALILTPVVSGAKFFGWILAINRTTGELGPQTPWQLCSGEFGSGEAGLIATTASILATHAANLQLVKETQQLMVQVVRSLVSAIDSKDPYTRGHSDRVALYARRIGEELGLSEAEAENLYLTGVLHDVGKIGVRDAVLQKTDKLTEEEFAEIARHPDEGWGILSSLRPLAYVLPGVLHHHERWDGGGYPDRLAEEEIPLEGRILAVADAFDAMTSDRPYRKGMPIDRAESILRDGAATQWDPKCVDAFFACREDIHRIKESYRIPMRPQRKPGTLDAFDEPFQPSTEEPAAAAT